MRGFTLLELLVVLTIVGIITAIALPKYNDYKKQAFDIRALSDLRNVALAEEAYFMQAERYLSCTGASCTSLPGMAAISKGVQLQVEAQAEFFTGNSAHPQGTGKRYAWNSSKGGLQN